MSIGPEMPAPMTDMGEPMQEEIPPELLAMLMGGGPEAPPPSPADMGPSPPPPGEGGAGGSPVDILKLMIDAAKAYIEVEQDAEDQATMSKVLQTLMQYLAREQADTQQALGNPSMQRVLRKSVSGPVA